MLVPCKGSLSTRIQSTCQFESYILIPVEEHFQTLDGKVFFHLLWVTQDHSLSVCELGRGGDPAARRGQQGPGCGLELEVVLVTSPLAHGASARDLGSHWDASSERPCQSELFILVPLGSEINF